MVEFALIMMLLVPIFLGVLHVGLTRHVQNTMTACVSEGARFGAQYDRSAAHGAQRARECIASSLSQRYASGVGAHMGSADGQPMVVVTARATVPLMGIGPDSWEVRVAGHAVKEALPG